MHSQATRTGKKNFSQPRQFSWLSTITWRPYFRWCGKGKTLVPCRPVSLRLPCFSVMCFSHLGCTLSHHRSTDMFPNTPCVSVVGWNPECVHFCSQRRISHILVSKVLVWRHCHHVFAFSWTRQSRPSPFCLVFTTSRLWRQNAQIVGSVKLERPSQQQMAKWRNLPGVVHWGLHVVLPRGPWFQRRFSLLLCHFCASVLLTRLSARCLPSSWPDTASIRSCLYSGKLAIAQEAVRVIFFCVFSIGPWTRCACAWWFLPADEEGPFTRCWIMKVLHPSFKLFLTLSSCPCLSHSFRPYNRETPGRARNVFHPGAWLRTNHTNLLDTDWLICDFSCTYVVTFRPIPHLTRPRLLPPLLLNFLCQAGYVNGNPSGSLLANGSKKAYLEKWIFTGDSSSDEQRVTNFPVLLHSTDHTDYIRCQRLVLGKGAKVLIRKSAQGTCHPHHGRKWRAGEWKRRWETWTAKSRRESRRESSNTQHERMKMTHVRSARHTPNWSQCQCDIKMCALKREKMWRVRCAVHMRDDDPPTPRPSKMSLVLQIARTLQCPLSWSTVRLQPLSEILHQYEI